MKKEKTDPFFSSDTNLKSFSSFPKSLESFWQIDRPKPTPDFCYKKKLINFDYFKKIKTFDISSLKVIISSKWLK